MSLIISGILASLNFFANFEAGLKSIFDISTSGNFESSSTNSVLSIGAISNPLSERYFVIVLRAL